MKQTTTLLATVIATCLFTSCGKTNEGQKIAVPMRVESEVIHLSSDINKKSYVGIVEEVSSISVGFTGSGTITKVHVSEGQSVKRGQLIAEIDKTQALNMVSAAEAQMEQATDGY